MDEEIVATSLDEVNEALESAHHVKYVVIDTGEERPWRMAKIAHERVASSIVVLASVDIAAEVRESFDMGDEDMGVTFGFDDEVHDQLSAERAGSAGDIEEALRAARA